MTRASDFYFDFVSPYILPRDHAAPSVDVLEKAGLAGEKLLEGAASDEVAARLDRETAAAAERGVFGSPTFVVDDELYFGNDRLDFVAAALAAAKT